MAKFIKTVAAEILAKIISSTYQSKSICVVGQATIQEKGILTLFQNCESIALARTPVNIYNGAAEKTLLYPILTYALDDFLLKKDKSDYVPGTIVKRIGDRGRDFTQAVKALSLVQSKAGINNEVDIALGMFLSESTMVKTDFSQATKDFLWNMLNDKKTRTDTLNRLTKDVKLPVPGGIDINAVGEAAAILTLGKGEVIPPEYYHLHQAVRSIILATIRSMIDYALSSSKHEVFSDVLALLSLFMVYINVTENDNTYETAFPTLASAGSNPIMHNKRIQGFKQLAMIYSKMGFAGKAFSGVLTHNVISEMFKLFPDISDINVYASPTYDSNGNPVIDMSKLSFIKESSVRFDKAKEVFDSILPSMFKGYVENVISELKKQTGAEIILPSLFDDLTGVDPKTGKSSPIFADLSADFLKGKKVVITNPEANSERVEPKSLQVSMQTIQKFLLTHFFTGIESMYQASVSLRTSYDRVFQSLGTPTGGMIPGVSIELDTLSEGPTNSIPDITDATKFVYAKLNERHIWPLALPALAISQDKRQVWTLSHLKYSIFRPERLALKYAVEGSIEDLPPHLSLNYYDNKTAHERWAWLENTMPLPTYTQNVGFAYTPIPANYTVDCIFDFMKNSGIKVDQFMTRTNRVPSLSYMTYGETLSEYISSGAVQPQDIAMSVAGFAFIYQLRGKSWEMIDPQIPTIYGMPTIFMRDMNEIAIQDNLVKIGSAYFPIDKEGSDGQRIIYDRSNREIGVGTTVLVLHKFVPPSKKLRYMIQTLRDGFVVKVPFLEQLFNCLFSNAQTRIKEQYDLLKPELEKAIKGISELPTANINAVFNSVVTIFQNLPKGGVGTSKGAETYFGEYFSDLKISYAQFQAKYFEPVLGWSEVVVPYPHLTMTDRFLEFYKPHFSSWLRSYTSRHYIDASHMKDREQISVLVVSPNVMQQMDYDDEVSFLNSELLKITEIKTTYDKTPSSQERENAHTDEEAQVQGLLVKHESKMEGHDTQIGTGDVKNPPEGYIPPSEFVHTINPLTKEEEVAKEQKLKEYGSSPKNKDDKNLVIDESKTTITETNKKVTDEVGNSEKANDKGETDDLGNVLKTAKDVLLDKGKTDVNKNINKGEGDIEDDSEEEKKKKANKKKNLGESHSDEFSAED